MSINYLIYISAAKSFISRREINNILASAKQYNPEHDITGILLYHDDFFLQMLEGPNLALEKLFSRIKADPRHTCLYEPLRGSIPKRFFPKWSMGFSQFDQVSEKSRINTFSNLLEKLAEEQNPYETEDRLDFLRSFEISLTTG